MNEKGEITTTTKEIQTIFKTHPEQLYTNKLGNRVETDAFPENHKLPKPEQEDTENLNRPISREETEAVIIKDLPRHKSPGPDGFPGECYQTFKEETVPITTKVVPKDRWNASKLVLGGHHHLKSKSRQRSHQKRRVIDRQSSRTRMQIFSRHEPMGSNGTLRSYSP